MPTGARMKRITNDAREDEMEENLDAVGDIVGNLRAQVWRTSVTSSERL